MTTAPALTGLPTTQAASSTAWMAGGLCRQVDSAIFFPEGRGGAVAVQTEQAKRICNRCPVRESCLEWAVETGQAAGVWGGMSEDERRALIRDRSGQYERCIDAQELIEDRIAGGAKYREVADELGVGHSAVCRAVKFFRREREEANA